MDLSFRPADKQFQADSVCIPPFLSAANSSTKYLDCTGRNRIHLPHLRTDTFPVGIPRHGIAPLHHKMCQEDIRNIAYFQ
jgi:hypothetical protein